MPATTETIRALNRVSARATKATKERDELIRQAITEGGTLREVGAAAGLSHQAVKFIARGRPAH